MLDRGEVLAIGQRHVVGGDVVLQVDEALALPARAQHLPERADAAALGLSLDARRRTGLALAETGLARRLGAGDGTLFQAFAERDGATGGPRHPASLFGHIGHEGGEALVVAK